MIPNLKQPRRGQWWQHEKRRKDRLFHSWMILNRNHFSFIFKFSKILQQLANQYSSQQHDQQFTHMHIFIHH